MNITFTLKANTYRKAADIEDFLKTHGINYESRTDDKPSLGSGRQLYRHNQFPRITKDKMKEVIADLDNNPDQSYVTLGQKYNLHQQTISKLARGVHVMQKKARANGSDELEPAEIIEKHLRRTPITKAELAAVISTINGNQSMGDSGIARLCKVSQQTVGRIRSGTHSLQINGDPE